MNILVTGGAGFIGSHVAETLAKNNHRVMVIDNFRTGKTENLKGFHGKIELCDITDYKLLQKVVSDFRPQVIHHLAAQSAISISEAKPAYDARVNVLGTLNLLQLAKEVGVQRFIFSSTSAVYPERWSFLPLFERTHPDPQSPYGISKAAAEQYIRLSGIPHVIFRYGNVYGPRQVSIGENQLVARSLSHFEDGTDFSINGDGNQKRDFVYVRDVAFLHLLLTNPSDITGTYNLASGKSMSVNDVLRYAEDLYGVRGYRWEHNGRYDPRRNVRIDNSKIRRHTGMIFTSMQIGMAETISWWQNRG